MASRLNPEVARFTAAAQLAEKTCDDVLSATENWQNLAKKNLPPSEELDSVQEAAYDAFDDLLDLKVASEKARFQINQRLLKAKKTDDPRLIADLEHQQKILNNACDSMMADFEPAREAIESLLGGNQDDRITAAWNTLLGKSPHFKEFTARRRTRSASAGSDKEIDVPPLRRARSDSTCTERERRPPSSAMRRGSVDTILDRVKEENKTGVSQEKMSLFQELLSQ